MQQDEEKMVQSAFSRSAVRSPVFEGRVKQRSSG
jgi:hypothetical protein